jgi:hypothetical protein
LSHAMTNSAATAKKATMITTKVTSFLNGSSSTAREVSGRIRCTDPPDP